MLHPSSCFRKWNEETGYLSNIGGQGSMSSGTTTLEPQKDVGEEFRPTAQQLATHYLKLMLLGYYCLVSKIPVIDIYDYEPWDLPDASGLSLSSPEWYFFSPRRDKNRSRTSRLTKGGQWKSTGQDRVIKDETDGLVFKKKTLVYYKGRSKDRDNRTNWIVHEIRAILGDGTTQGEYVLCTLFKNPDQKAKVPTKGGGEPSSRMASGHGHLLAERNTNFPTPTSYEGNSNLSVSTSSEGQTPDSYATSDLETNQLSVSDYGDWY